MLFGYFTGHLQLQYLNIWWELLGWCDVTNKSHHVVIQILPGYSEYQHHRKEVIGAFATLITLDPWLMGCVLFIFWYFCLQNVFDPFHSTNSKLNTAYFIIGRLYCELSSLTHWKKWCSSLFSSLKITRFFVAKHWFFSSKRTLFHDKTQTFQSKMNLLFFR